MSNDASISITNIYITAKLDTRNIPERVAFLSALTLILSQNTGNISKEFLAAFIDTEEHFEELENYPFNESEKLIAERLINFHENVKLKSAIKSLLTYFSANSLECIGKIERITLYEQTLKRLQEPNLLDRLSADFDCQIIPDDFSRLLAALHKSDSCNVYDAMAKTGEISTFLSAINPSWTFTTESIMQSSEYIADKFVIAGCLNARVSQSYALSAKTLITQSEFDFSFALYEPTGLRKSDKSKQDEGRLAGFFHPNRIDNETSELRYREHALIQHLLWSISDTGIAVAIVGRGPLQRQEEILARQKLIHGNFVDAVIQLPPRLINARTVVLYALIIRKNKSNDDVLFIDASTFYERSIRRNRLVNEDKIAKIFKARESVEGVAKVVCRSDILNNFCFLNVASYLSTLTSTLNESSLDKALIELTYHQKKTTEIYDKLMSIVDE